VPANYIAGILECKRMLNALLQCQREIMCYGAPPALGGHLYKH